MLGETGSHNAAARAASPHLADSTSPRPGYESFKDIRKMDLEFATACEEALSSALGKVEAAIVERAFTLDTRPIFDKDGNQLGVQTDSRPANQMLLRLAERLHPKRWTQRKQSNVTASVEHTHTHRHGMVVFKLETHHLALLPEERRQRFIEDLQLIRATLEQQEAPHAQLPTNQPEQVPRQLSEEPEAHRCIRLRDRSH